jgi:general secretion pathway protein B
MSYILEALKRSDQLRQLGATPTLLTAQTPMTSTKQPMYLYFSLFATALLGAGILIGWLHPWQTAPAAEPVAEKSPISIPHRIAPAPLPKSLEMAGKTAQELAAPNSAPPVQPTSITAGIKPEICTSTRTERHSASPKAAAPTPPPTPLKLAGTADATEAALEPRVTPMAELPLLIRQELPAMKIQVHAYSSKPKDRLVSINDRILREGCSLTPGLRLEQITPDGLIFSHKEYRFRRDIHSN